MAQQTAKKPMPAGKKVQKKQNTKQTGSSSSSGKEPMLLEFLTDQLKDIYWAEKHLTKALPKMAKAATSGELRDAFNEHLEVTREHVTKVEEVFGLLEKKPQAKKCDAMEGLSKEADSVIEETEKGSATRDVGLIISAQKVEHYEIAAYGGLSQLARTLELEDVAEILEGILEQEKEADTTLTEIAENNVNYEAATEEGEEEDESDEESDEEEEE